MKKSTVIIVGVLIAIPLIIVLCCAVLFGVGFKKMGSEYSSLKTGILTPACTSVANKRLTQDKYDELFTDAYKRRYSLTEAETQLESAMPVNDCSTFDLGGITDVIKKNISVSISTENGQTTATVSYPIEGADSSIRRTATIELLRDDSTDHWMIDSITVD